MDELGSYKEVLVNLAKSIGEIKKFREDSLESIKQVKELQEYISAELVEQKDLNKTTIDNISNKLLEIAENSSNLQGKYESNYLELIEGIEKASDESIQKIDAVTKSSIDSIAKSIEKQKENQDEYNKLIEAIKVSTDGFIEYVNKFSTESINRMNSRLEQSENLFGEVAKKIVGLEGTIYKIEDSISQKIKVLDEIGKNLDKKTLELARNGEQLSSQISTFDKQMEEFSKKIVPISQAVSLIEQYLSKNPPINKPNPDPVEPPIPPVEKPTEEGVQLSEDDLNMINKIGFGNIIGALENLNDKKNQNNWFPTNLGTVIDRKNYTNWIKQQTSSHKRYQILLAFMKKNITNKKIGERLAKLDSKKENTTKKEQND